MDEQPLSIVNADCELAKEDLEMEISHPNGKLCKILHRL
jgi:hypothetical protein